MSKGMPRAGLVADDILWLDDQACLYLWRGLLGPEEAAAASLRLHTELPWAQPEIKVFGRWHRIPRLQSWHGDAEARYRYASLTMTPHPWHPALQRVRAIAQARTGLSFNSVLANLYRDGDDRMGWHADDERELGAEPWIASYSVGAARRFSFRRKANHRDRHDIVLAHDELLLMSPAVQHHWQHALPVSRRIRDWRINLTFRLILPGNQDADRLSSGLGFSTP